MSSRQRQDAERASSLDITDEELRRLAALTAELVADYFARVSEFAVFPDTSAEKLSKIFRTELPREGGPLEQLLEDWRAVVEASRHNGHPRMFGYVASPSTPVSAFANLLASAVNQNVTSWRSSPAATEVEKTTVRWLAEMIGYVGHGLNETCGGLLTSGGSMANLIALYSAHRAKATEGAHDSETENPSRRGLWDAGRPMIVYASEQVHFSITKAADVLGLGREHVRLVETDESFRLDVRALRRRIEADARAGLRPFCVVASAGTVSTGAVDPLSAVAGVAREHSLWFHVDGAYGALARLAASKRSLFEGIELADSVALDPHKWLYAPVDCGCLIFRDAERVHAAFGGAEAQYVKVFEHDEEALAFWNYGVELSRPFRALKVWAMLRYYGVRRIADAIEDDCALAAHMAERIKASEEFELLAPVALSICCFRYVPPRLRRALAEGDETERERANTQLDELNQRIMHKVQRGGEAYLSNADLRGRFALRASITNFRTTREDIDLTLDIIRRAARELNQGEGINKDGQDGQDQERKAFES